jgi:c-di-GMP-binding flagellar brake protein YcgR
MFGLLRSSLSARQPASATRQDPATILRLLNQLHCSRGKVTLHAEDASGVHCFRTCLARVQRKDRGIVLHRPVPQDGQGVLAPGSRVLVTCFMPSGPLTFFSQLWPLDGGDSQYCTLTMPEEVSTFQLRSAFRVFMPVGSSKALLHLQDATGTSLRCETTVLDLSLEGCGLHFAARADTTGVDALLPLLQQQPRSPRAEFDLLNGSLRFSSDLLLCRASASRSGQVFAGMQFLPLPPTLSRQLQTLLTEVQRQQVRRQLAIP